MRVQGWDTKKYLAQESAEGSGWGRWGMMLLLCAGVSCALGAMAMAALRRQAAASRADGRERAAAWWLEWHELTERER